MQRQFRRNFSGLQLDILGLEYGLKVSFTINRFDFLAPRNPDTFRNG